MNSATAGSAQIANMIRQTPVTSLKTLPMIALITNAESWPITMATSLRPAIEPRISYGAISARKTGTTAEAPPTARPSRTRPSTRIS